MVDVTVEVGFAFATLKVGVPAKTNKEMNKETNNLVIVIFIFFLLLSCGFFWRYGENLPFALSSEVAFV